MFYEDGMRVANELVLKVVINIGIEADDLWIRLNDGHLGTESRVIFRVTAQM